MLKILRKIIIFAVLGAALLAATVVSAGAAEADAVLLSPGLDVIAARCGMVVSGVPGGEVVFTREDFARAVGFVPENITITRRPDSAVGQLTMGSVVIPEGQVLSRASLDRMAFMPSNLPAASDTVFSFTADGSAYEYVCTVRLTDAGSSNSAPTLECATAASLSARVPEGGVCGGILAASDPEGDALVFEITSYPRHGSVLLTDSANGRYVYRPTSGYTGRDSFTYTVRDEWGNYAGEAEVNVTVSRFSAPDYADMAGSSETFARICEAEGLMSGSVYGGGTNFYPEKGMTRAEFTVTLLTAAGITPDREAECSFSDAADVPASARAYVATAQELGLTRGWIKNGEIVFEPNGEITLAEAAHMTALLLGLNSDRAVEVSVGGANFARYELDALCSAGVAGAFLDVSPSEPLCRADAAEIFCGVLALARAGGVPNE